MSDFMDKIDDLLEAVLSGRYGTKNRSQLIQSLENLKNPPGVSQWMSEGKKWGYDKYFRGKILEEVEELMLTVQCGECFCYLDEYELKNLNSLKNS